MGVKRKRDLRKCWTGSAAGSTQRWAGCKSRSKGLQVQVEWHTRTPTSPSGQTKQGLFPSVLHWTERNTHTELTKSTYYSLHLGTKQHKSGSWHLAHTVILKAFNKGQRLMCRQKMYLHRSERMQWLQIFERYCTFICAVTTCHWLNVRNSQNLSILLETTISWGQEF